MASSDQRFFVKPDSDCAIAPRVIELLAAIRGEHELDPKLLSRVVERPQLIAGRRRKQQDSGHVSLEVSSGAPESVCIPDL